MTDVRVALTCADYARVLPLATGEVRPQGIALTMILGNRGSWPARAEMLGAPSRTRRSRAASGRWLSTCTAWSTAIIATSACPCSRCGTSRRATCTSGGTARSAGPRIWPVSASACTATRPAARSGTDTSCAYLGLDPAAIQWWVGDIDTPWSAPMDVTLPPGVHAPPKGRSLSDLLVAGDLEAIYSPPRPEAYHPRSGPIARLFPDFRAVEQEYFRKTGAFPPQHLIVLRREAWDRNRWIARTITEAFSAANDVFTAAQKGFPYATPWLEAELEDTEAVMGSDFHPYGLEQNRAQIEMFAGEAFRLGLTARRVTVEEYFQDFLAS